MHDVLITGASGFSAAALAERLQSEGNFRLIALSRSPPKNPSPYSRIIQADLQDVARTHEILTATKPSWIFHLAGKLNGTTSELFQSNLQNTIHLIEAVDACANDARVLLIGSAAEYGNLVDEKPVSETHPCDPQTDYGISKFAMTKVALTKRAWPHLNVARVFNLIGPGIPSSLLLGAVIERARDALASGKDVISVGDVSAERDFIDVRDAAEAYLTIMKSFETRQIFNVCSGNPTKIQDLVEAALKHAPRAIRYEVDPALAKFGPKSIVGDPGKLRALGFNSRYSLEASVADTCAALRS
jgi:nucleoside-diphosphate-sugar epimerase